MSQEKARRFRKKPVVVEAMRYDGPSYVECRGGEIPRLTPTFDMLHRFVGRHFSTLHVGSGYHGGPEQYAPAIRTPEGVMRVSPGDWVIRGTRGECYPCKPGPFADTFEPAAVPSLAAEVERLMAECERHRRANLVRTVINGWDETIDGALTDYINEHGWDAVPWKVAERLSGEVERLRAALQRIAKEPAPGTTVSCRNIAKAALAATLTDEGGGAVSAPQASRSEGGDG